MKDRRALKLEYLFNSRPMGVFLIRNTVNDRVFVASGIDLAGVINRHRFQLSIGEHANRELQNDWNKLGSDKFSFEIVDELKPTAEISFDSRRELAFMEAMWLDKLQPYDERGYNQRKFSREERLHRMAANRIKLLV